MQTVLTITLPFFALIACGYLAGRAGIIGEASRAGLNNFVFYFALPVLLFSLMARSDLGLFEWRFVIAYLSVSIGLFLVGLAAARMLFGLDAREGAIHSACGIYGNSGYVGVPLVVIAFGEQASVPVVLCLTMDLVVMMPFAVAVMEAAQGAGGHALEVPRRTAMQLAKNPLILAIVAGTAVSVAELPLPEILERFIDLLGAPAAPCALFVLGASLVGSPIAAGFGQVAAISLVKLVVHPIAVWIAMVDVFAVNPQWATSAVIASTMPVAVTVFVLAQQYRSYVVRCSTAVLVSTVLSVVTVSLFVAWFSAQGLEAAG